MLALAERRLVKTTVPQCDQDGIFVGARNPHRIAVGRTLLRLTSPLPFGPSGPRHLQLQAISQFLDRIAQLGRPRLASGRKTAANVCR